MMKPARRQLATFAEITAFLAAWLELVQQCVRIND